VRLLTLCLLLALSGSIQAQTYPSKSVRMLLAFPPGGPTDINARLFAQKLSGRRTPAPGLTDFQSSVN